MGLPKLRDLLQEKKTGTQPLAQSESSAPPPPVAPAPLPEPSAPPIAQVDASLEQMKIELHRSLIDRLNLDAFAQIKSEDEQAQAIRKLLTDLVSADKTPLSQRDKDAVVQEVIYEVLGLGPIEPLIRDRTISDILVNGPKDIFVERRGKLTRVPASFRDNAHLLTVIDRIVSRVGRRVDESSPMVDARLPDGSRVNAIIPPLAIDGAALSIRRFGSDLTIDRLVANGALTEDMVMFLSGCVKARLNIIISGGTGSGKTTVLNALSGFIQTDQRVLTIEDAAELKLQQEHVVRLETRPPNAEGRGEVIARDLVKNALRMRPDRIIVGEVRAGEALDMLQAMNTGHDGSLTTVHANTPRDAISRLETMVLMAGTNLPNRAIRDQIASAVNLIIQASRLSDGSRRITSITEITGMEEEVITSQEIFAFEKRGISEDGKVIGHFTATGVRPQCYDKLRTAGIPISPALFTNTSL